MAFPRNLIIIPCELTEQYNKATAKTQLQLMRRFKWMRQLSEQEWNWLLKNKYPRPNKRQRTQIRRKMVSWLLMLARLTDAEPELWNEAVHDADAFYLADFHRHIQFLPERSN